MATGPTEEIVFWQLAVFYTFFADTATVISLCVKM